MADKPERFDKYVYSAGELKKLLESVPDKTRIEGRASDKWHLNKIRVTFDPETSTQLATLRFGG
jgi:hypothetical protein